MSDTRYPVDGTIWTDDPSKYLTTPLVVGTLNFHDTQDMKHAIKAIEYYSALWHLEEAIRRMLRGKEPVDLQKLLDMIPELED